MSAADPRPRLALVGPVVRADLCAAFRHFRRFHVINFYQETGGDLAPGALDGQVRYGGDWDLYRKLLAARPVLIQGCEPLWFPTGTRACVVVQAAARRLGVPYFFPMLENRPVALRFRGWRWPVGAGLRRLLGWYGRGAAAVFALNRGAEANLRAAGVPAEKVRRVMWGCWGVDTGEYAPDPHGPCREPRLLFVGRLVVEKGLEDFVEAFRLVRARVPAARLRVVGDGPLRDWLKARAGEFGGALEVAGPRPNREMPDEFHRAMVTVTPSRTVRNWEEQVGMVNLQSLACGVPIASTRSGAIPEYVRDGVDGLLVPEQDPVALAEACLRLLTDEPLRRRMGAAARQEAVARYDLAANVARSEEALVGLLGRDG